MKDVNFGNRIGEKVKNRQFFFQDRKKVFSLSRPMLRMVVIRFRSESDPFYSRPKFFGVRKTIGLPFFFIFYFFTALRFCTTMMFGARDKHLRFQVFVDWPRCGSSVGKAA